MDPQDRKVIVVASKKTLCKIACRAFLERFVKVAKFTADVGSVRYPLLLPVSFVPTSVIIKGGGDLWFKLKEKEYMSKPTSEILSEVNEALDLGVSLVLFDPSEAARIFNFGVGQTPIDGTLYVQHPVVFDAYIDPADFSRTISKEKEAAFRQLASSLGAKKVILIRADVHTKKGLFGSTVPIQKAAAEIGIKVDIDQKRSLVKTVYSEYGEPRRKPHVPADLQPWVDMDADLRTMARDRIEGNLLREAIALEFKEGIGLGGGIAEKLANKGFTATSSYEAICHSVWYFDVEYYPIKI